MPDTSWPSRCSQNALKLNFKLNFTETAEGEARQVLTIRILKCSQNDLQFLDAELG